MDPSEAWLEQWHDRKPGATARAFASGKPSSYEWLAARVAPACRALDLACGDGALLEALAARGVLGAVGIDMSAGELASARARLGPEAQLVQGKAQALPFEGASFDSVTCHLALMLMRPVDEVVAEIVRVLRPGGLFAAILGGAPPVSGEDAFRRLVFRLKEEYHERPPPFSIGDPRTRTEEGLRGLFSGFSEVRVERIVVDLAGKPEEILELFRLTYDFDFLEPERARAVEEAVLGDWAGLTRVDGTLPCAFAFWGVTAVRP